MSKSQWAFRPTEVTRAIKAAEKAGKTVAEVDIDPSTGKIVLKFRESGASPDVNEWLEAAE